MDYDINNEGSIVCGGDNSRASSNSSNIYGNVNRFLFYANELVFPAVRQVEHRKYTGYPIVKRYNITSANDSNFLLSLNVLCEFQFTQADKVEVTINVQNRFDLLYYSPPTKTHEATTNTGVLDCVNRAATYVGKNYLGRDFPYLLSVAHQEEGIDNQERAFVNAYSVADNDHDRLEVLRSLINALESYQQYIMKLWYEDKDNEKRDQLSKWNAQKIEKYLALLPSNYIDILKPGNIANSFCYIIRLLTQGKIDDGWLKYQRTPPLCYFLQRTCPNLAVISHQLSAIFIITGHKKTVGNNIHIPHHSIMHYAQAAFEKANKVANEDLDSIASAGEEDQAASQIRKLIDLGIRAKEDTPVNISQSIYEMQLADRTQPASAVCATSVITKRY